MDAGQPVCFDWLVWSTLHASLARRPADAHTPLAMGVQHHKSEDQVPDEHAVMWDDLRSSPLVQIENAAHWNMASKRMETQARLGDILITLGGGEGVLFLANLYHDAGKPVVPLNLPICAEGKGSRRLHDFGLTKANSHKLFQIAGGDAHHWMNRIRFPKRQSVPERVGILVELLEALERPIAFAVRLLDPANDRFDAVQSFFDNVAQPVVEELGYRLVVIDDQHSHDLARIDQEIFAKLHRASLVVADLTGERPNCFLELGYAMGRGLATVVTAQKGTRLPFDVTTYAAHLWTPSASTGERRRELLKHLQMMRNRPPLVPAEGLIA